MFSVSLTTLAATGFTVAFFHAAIPTHWLPFVLIARTRHWSRARTMLITSIAGVGHILLTSMLGLIIAWCGFQVDERLERAFPWMAGGLLMAIGGYYSWRQICGAGICRHPLGGGHHHANAQCVDDSEAGHSHQKSEVTQCILASERTGDWPAISGLFVMLTLSPCEGFLPVYLSGVQFGWHGFIVLSTTLAVATLLGMLLFTYLTLVGMEGFKLQRLERYDAGLLGALFSILGVLVLVAEH